jgi:hypothetical protein
VGKPGAGKDLTPKAFAVWTAILAVILAAGVWGALVRVGPLGFALGFVPALFIAMGLSWPGRWDRLLPAAAATAIVGVWPLVRWLADGDERTPKVYFVIAGMFATMLLMFTGMERAMRYAKGRGWIFESPIRRRIRDVAMLICAAVMLTGWPTGVWRTGIVFVWFGATLLTQFWPPRRHVAPA